MALLQRVLSVLIILFVCFLLGKVLCTDLNLDFSVLLEVKKAFVKDPENVLHDWDESNPNFCAWNGISCGLITRAT